MSVIPDRRLPEMIAGDIGLVEVIVDIRIIGNSILSDLGYVWVPNPEPGTEDRLIIEPPEVTDA